MNIFNQARIDYIVSPPKSLFPINRTTFSNEALTIITDNIISTTMTVNKSTVSIYEVITYCIKIVNLTANPIHKIFLKDNLESTIHFIPCSTLINNECAYCCNPVKGFYLPILQSFATTTVCFSCIAIQTAPNEFTNSAILEFFYTDNPLINPFLVRVTTNSITTQITHTLFQQIKISNRFSPPLGYPKAYGINNISAIITSISMKLLPPPTYAKFYEPEGQSLLLIIGKIEYTIDYQFIPLDNNEIPICKSNVQLIFTEPFGFSTTIEVPNGMKYELPDKIRFTIEDITHTIYRNEFNCTSFILIDI